MRRGVGHFRSAPILDQEMSSQAGPEALCRGSMISETKTAVILPPWPRYSGLGAGNSYRHEFRSASPEDLSPRSPWAFPPLQLHDQLDSFASTRTTPLTTVPGKGSTRSDARSGFSAFLKQSPTDGKEVRSISPTVVRRAANRESSATGPAGKRLQESKTMRYEVRNCRRG